MQRKYDFSGATEIKKIKIKITEKKETKILNMLCLFLSTKTKHKYVRYVLSLSINEESLKRDDGKARKDER
jgi:hypothetical protein